MRIIAAVASLAIALGFVIFTVATASSNVPPAGSGAIVRPAVGPGPPVAPADESGRHRR